MREEFFLCAKQKPAYLKMLRYAFFEKRNAFKQIFRRAVMLWDVIALLAVVATSFNLLPQLIKGLRTRSLHDVSTGTMLLLLIGGFLWLIHALHRKDLALGVTNVLIIIFSSTLLVLKKNLHPSAHL